MSGTESADLNARAKTVRDHLDGQLDDMLAMLEQFVNVESGSREKDAVDRMGQVYREVLEPMDFSTEIIEQPESGIHVIFRRRGNGKGKVLILSHLDTVWPSGTLEWWPFKIEDGLATGPGVGDMKGGIVQAIFALRAIEDLDLMLPEQVTYFFIGDEELGSPTARPHVERLGREHDYVLVTEPSNFEGSIISGRGGIGAFKVDVYGKTAHASMSGDGASAISALAHKIIAFDGLHDPSRNVRTNVGLIEGGSARQTLAGHASCWLDLRVPNDAERDALWPKVVAIVEQEHVPGTRAEISGHWSRPPSPQSDADRKLFDRAAELASALGFELTGRHVGGGSDGSYTSALGIPTIDGLGPYTADVVSSRERIKIDSLPERAALMTLLLDSIARTGKTD